MKNRVSNEVITHTIGCIIGEGDSVFGAMCYRTPWVKLVISKNQFEVVINNFFVKRRVTIPFASITKIEYRRYFLDMGMRVHHLDPDYPYLVLLGRECICMQLSQIYKEWQREPLESLEKFTNTLHIFSGGGRFNNQFFILPVVKLVVHEVSFELIVGLFIFEKRYIPFESVVKLEYTKLLFGWGIRVHTTLYRNPYIFVKLGENAPEKFAQIETIYNSWLSSNSPAK